MTTETVIAIVEAPPVPEGYNVQIQRPECDVGDPMTTKTLEERIARLERIQAWQLGGESPECETGCGELRVNRSRQTCTACEKRYDDAWPLPGGWDAWLAAERERNAAARGKVAP